MIAPRVVAELVRIHRPATTYQGLSPAGELHLMAGGSIGGEEGMPMAEGMVGYRTCVACRAPRELSGAWPCETIRLLLEAGEIPAGAVPGV